MTRPFKGIINVDIRDSGAGMCDEYEVPFKFTGGTINGVPISVGGEPYVDVEKEAQAVFSRQ